MKKFIFAASLLMASIVHAQLVNNGATIVIQSGGTIFCGGNFSNNSGTVTNNGKIEVQGNFANGGIYNSNTNNDSIVLTGTGSVSLGAGGALFHYLTINKATNDVVTLAGSVLVNNKLDYLSGILSTDYLNNPSYSVTAPASAVFNFGSGREIIGNVKRTGWTNGAAVLFNSANMQVATNGGTPPSEIMATMIPNGDPSQNEKEVKRKFFLANAGGGGFTADVRFPYATAELGNNLEANLVPWHLLAAEWNAKLLSITRDSPNDWVSVANVDAASFAQEWKLADPNYSFDIKAHLRGAWNGTEMSTAVNSILPTLQPFTIAPYNYVGVESVTSIPNADIVDWVLIDFRKPADGLPSSATSSTIIGRKAAFLLKNGSVVELDGITPVSLTLSKQGSGFVVLRHRNHLPVMSNSLASNSAGIFINDFSVLGNSYNNVLIGNIPQQSLPNSTKYGLWAGDANRDGVVNASDIGLIKSQANVAIIGYQFGDANMDTTVNASDVGLAKLSANVSATSHSGRGSSPTVKKSHVPAD